jgi:hypothetical protein
VKPIPNFPQIRVFKDYAQVDYRQGEIQRILHRIEARTAQWCVYGSKTDRQDISRRFGGLFERGKRPVTKADSNAVIS